MTDQDQLSSLQLRVAMAEAARLVAAEQAAARRSAANDCRTPLGSERTGGHHLQAQSVQVPDAAQLPRGTARLSPARLVQYFDDRDTRTQQTADAREARREQATAEREARGEAQHMAQLAALRGSPPTGSHPCSFIPNKGFSEIQQVSGTRDQALLP